VFCSNYRLPYIYLPARDFIGVFPDEPTTVHSLRPLTRFAWQNLYFKAVKMFTRDNEYCIITRCSSFESQTFPLSWRPVTAYRFFFSFFKPRIFNVFKWSPSLTMIRPFWGDVNLLFDVISICYNVCLIDLSGVALVSPRQSSMVVENILLSSAMSHVLFIVCPFLFSRQVAHFAHKAIVIIRSNSRSWFSSTVFF